MKHIENITTEYLPQSDVHRTKGKSLFSCKKVMLSNHNKNKNIYKMIKAKD